MTTPGAASAKSTGLAYKIGLGVVAIGIVMFASSWLLGGVLFAAIMAVLDLLGAPENRQFLPPNEPEAGGQILQLHGGALIACGTCIVGLRLLAELIGLAGSSTFISRLNGADRLGLGLAAIGWIVAVSTGLSQLILYEIFLYEYGTGAAMSALETAGSLGGIVFLGALAVLILGRPNLRGMLLGWTDRVGWGKLGHGWVNKLALGLIVLGLVGGILGFEDPFTIVAAAGIAILLVGIVPHILAGGSKPP